MHVACCIGNLCAKVFSKFTIDQAKKRELLSASVSAGVSVRPTHRHRHPTPPHPTPPHLTPEATLIPPTRPAPPRHLSLHCQAPPHTQHIA